MNHQEFEARTPDLMLERYLLEELPPAEMAEMRRRIESDPELWKRLEALQESNRELLDRFPAEQVSRRIEEKLAASPGDGERSPFWSRLRLIVALPAALLLALLIALPVVLEPDGEISPGERLKGPGPTLQLFRKTASGSERLADGAPASERDLILVRYQAAGRGHGVLLSIDGRGNVTRHLPESGREAAELHQGGAIPLPFAYELDDAPDWESFYLIASREPFAVERVMSAARKMGAAIVSGAVVAPDSLVLPSQLEQTIITLNKVMGSDNPGQGSER